MAKIEQLYPKGTKEYYYQLTSNLYELTIFIENKFGKYIAYDDNLSNEEKINKVNKLAKLYTSISGDNDYEILGMIIRGTIKDLIHISKLIGFGNQEIETLVSINKQTNR